MVTTILGISCYFHDASAALIRDGVVIAASAEERFSRIKHDFNFPEQAVALCLATAGIAAADVDYVVFYEKPFVKFQRIFLSTLRYFPKTHASFRESMVAWFKDKLWMRELISERTGIPADRVLFSTHHLSHAASAFYCSPFDDAAILTVDGVGEWSTTTRGRGTDNRISLTSELRFPDSLGLLYSAFTAFLGFEVNEGEYKVMGMAPYGKPTRVDDIMELIELHDDGSFSLDMRYFSYQYSIDRSFSPLFEQKFGAPRDPLAGDSLEGPYADIAASIQVVTERLLVRLCAALHREYPVERLCMAGGVALNCVANRAVVERTPFKELYVQPAAGDGGAALGAALYVYHHVLGNKRAGPLAHAYWGAEFPVDRIIAFLKEKGRTGRVFLTERELTDTVAGLLAEGKVVGWFQGRAEWGPRALGNRSILADPRLPGMKDTINRKVKFREPFRPFAPAVAAEAAADFFDVEEGELMYPYRFMLITSTVRPDKRALIPAVTHVDGSARVQVVYPGSNPRFHKLIQAFGARTGVPVLLNTSFNLKGEPIVNSPSDALSTFDRSGLDYLVMGNCIVAKENA